VIALPALIVLVAITLVGLPIAVILAALAVVLFVVGPVPAVTALGNRVLARRGGLFGALIVGAVLWRLGIWLIPYVGAALYVIGMVWGVGGWLMGAMATRRSDPIPMMLLPASVVAREDDSPWEPPLAPGMQRRPEPASGPDGSDDDVGTVSDTVDESSRPDVVVPPVIRTGTLATDEAVRFDVADRDEHQSDTEVDDAGGDDAGGDDPGGDGARSGASASERFAALREELASTGTVEPPSTGDDEPDGEGPSTPRPPDDDDGWGLPTR
jgi:hypothetical protein